MVVSLEEWPEFVQPSNSEDAYNTGDKITYNGEKYICKMDGCVWAPDAYPDAWEKQ
ncbi:carbohydrate-binding protein [uncultured Subdoligranulum sp.]|uniref:carbohydrate-binding protein n=1 Tax=uncultured Subdoligranulum sp. TaxID=512298 RepID=UPI00344D15BF